MGESGSWRAPRRLALLALGAATVVFLVGPMLVVIPMSFTGGEDPVLAAARASRSSGTRRCSTTRSGRAAS